MKKKKKKTTRCVCGKDITTARKNVRHQLCINCYNKLIRAAKYKWALLGTKCICGEDLGKKPNHRRKGLCASCYSFLQRRIKHGSRKSAIRVLDDTGKKCSCGRKACWRKVCVVCIDRARESAEAIRRLKKLHERQATCLCGNPTCVVRGVCKQCHVYIGYRARKVRGDGQAKKKKLCLCGKKATTRGLCNSCIGYLYRSPRYRRKVLRKETP